MINFVIVENNSIFIEKIKKEIKNIMENKGHEIHIYNEFPILFKNSLENVVYIIDVKVDNSLDNIKKIRKDDLNKYVILINNVFDPDLIFNECLLILTILNSLTNWQENLRKAIRLILDNYEDKLILKKGGLNYYIPFKSIIYIKIQDRISQIVTNSNTYSFQISLNQLLEMLPESFKKQSRSLVINFDRVVVYYEDKRRLECNDARIIELK